MASEGPRLGGAAASTSVPVGEFDWVNPSNALAADDSRAVATAPRDDVISNALDVTGFGFSIPGGSTIDGIEVSIEKSGSSLDTTDWLVKLLDAGSEVGNNKMDFGNSWPTTDTLKEYGGASDTWGYSWSAAKINGSGFGVRIEVHIAIEAESARVDNIKITVHYTEGASSGSTGLLMKGVG